jgi:hypothetical protein
MARIVRIVALVVPVQGAFPVPCERRARARRRFDASATPLIVQAAQSVGGAAGGDDDDEDDDDDDGEGEGQGEDEEDEPFEVCLRPGLGPSVGRCNARACPRACMATPLGS